MLFFSRLQSHARPADDDSGESLIVIGSHCDRLVYLTECEVGRFREENVLRSRPLLPVQALSEGN